MAGDLVLERPVPEVLLDHARLTKKWQRAIERTQDADLDAEPGEAKERQALGRLELRIGMHPGRGHPQPAAVSAAAAWRPDASREQGLALAQRVTVGEGPREDDRHARRDWADEGVAAWIQRHDADARRLPRCQEIGHQLRELRILEEGAKARQNDQ